ncbi:MAG: flavin monoamine oxidase family protein [Pyrinomonadaceae bacterium]
MGNRNKVVIIGAGAAGLAAARDLAVTGCQVTIIEARDRVGGRIHTQRRHSSIVPIELGAEFVHGKHPKLLEIIEAASSPLCDVTERHWYFENGVLSKSHDFWNKLTALMDIMNPDQPDRSFSDFLDSLTDDEGTRRAKAVATRYVEGFHAAYIDRLGVHGLIKANEAENQINGNKPFRVLGGYDAVTQTLRAQAEESGAAVRLNTIVEELHWSAGSVKAVCLCGGRAEQIEGSVAVITLPVGVLQAQVEEQGVVKFVPRFPEDKLAAIRGVQMGHAVRITLRFRERFWEELDVQGDNAGEDLSQLGFIHYPEAPIQTWWTLLPIRAALMVGWVGGPHADKFVASGKDYALQQALTSLEQILGVSERRLRGLMLDYYMHDWTADPFSRGAYAYLPVGGLEAQRNLALPLESTLFFAGEATSEGHIGTVHGAIESGQRAAREVLARF